MELGIQIELVYTLHKDYLLLAGQSKAGMRVPVGVGLLYPDKPFDAYVEGAPIMRIFPSTELDMAFSLGGRFYFGGKKKTAPEKTALE